MMMTSSVALTPTLVATQTTAKAVVFFFRLTAYCPGGENLGYCATCTIFATENCKSCLKNFFLKPLDKHHPLCYNSIVPRGNRKGE